MSIDAAAATVLLERLEAEGAVKRTILELFRASDAEDWDAVRTCLCDDFSMSVSAKVSQDAAAVGAEAIRGAQMMITVLQKLAEKWHSIGIKNVMHILGEIRVQVFGHQALADACHVSYLCRSEDSSPRSIAGYRGNYRLRREDQGWKLVFAETPRMWAQGEPY